MLTALEIRILGYGVLALAIIAMTAYTTHKVDNGRYESLDAQYAKYQAQVQADAATSQKAAADALQAQIDARTSAEANNAKIIQSLQSQADGARGDADFAQRLLAAAAQARPTAHNSQVPAAGHQPGTTDAAEPPGGRSLARDIGNAAGECRDAIQRLAALQAELIPQLTTR